MDSINNELWLQKAIAFNVRARAEMWGRHNSEIMAFTFEYGLSNKTVEKLLLGWNKRKKLRPFENWGLEPFDNQGKMQFPEGIVVPYVVEENLKKVTIVGHLETSVNKNHIIPGSLPVSMVFGTSASLVLVADNILDGLLLVQECQFNQKRDDLCIILPHDLAGPSDAHAKAFLDKAGKVVFCCADGRESYSDWAGGVNNPVYLDYQNQTDLVSKAEGL